MRKSTGGWWSSWSLSWGSLQYRSQNNGCPTIRILGLSWPSAWSELAFAGCTPSTGNVYGGQSSPAWGLFTLLAAALSDYFVGTDPGNDWISVLVMGLGTAIIGAVLKRKDAKRVLITVSMFSFLVGIAMAPFTIVLKGILIAVDILVAVFFMRRNRSTPTKSNWASAKPQFPINPWFRIECCLPMYYKPISNHCSSKPDPIYNISLKLWKNSHINELSEIWHTGLLVIMTGNKKNSES